MKRETIEIKVALKKSSDLDLCAKVRSDDLETEIGSRNRNIVEHYFKSRCKLDRRASVGHRAPHCVGYLSDELWAVVFESRLSANVEPHREGPEEQEGCQNKATQYSFHGRITTGREPTG